VSTVAVPMRRARAQGFIPAILRSFFRAKAAKCLAFLAELQEEAKRM
jgi:hypothetical protein